MDTPLRLPRAIEAHTVTVLASIAPLGALLPAAWITGDHLIAYVDIPGPAAVCMAIGLEVMGIAIVATRVALTGRGLPHLEKRMDTAFIGYLIVVVTVNGVLSAVHMDGLTGWLLAHAIGKAVAEFVLAMMALPTSQLAGVRFELAAIDAKIEQGRMDQAQAHADAVTERERAQREANALTLQLRQMEIDEAAKIRTEKQAAKVAVAKQAPAPVVSAKPQPVKQPCKFGCGKLVTGTAGQNAHSDSCPENPNRKTIVPSEIGLSR